MKVSYMNPIELRVTHKNLTDHGVLVPLQEIRLMHLAGTCRDTAMSHRVLFTDDDGQTRYIKDRATLDTVMTVVDRPVFRTYDEVAPYIMRLERTLTNGH